MHGSSSVPKELQDIINQYGGKMRPTWGVPVEEIQLGIKNGVRKVNVDTDNRLAMTGAIRKVFVETPEKFDPRDYNKPAREAMKKVVAAAHDAVRPGRPRRRLQAGQPRRDGEGLQVPDCPRVNPDKFVDHTGRVAARAAARLWCLRTRAYFAAATVARSPTGTKWRSG